MLLNILQCIGRCPTAKGYQTQMLILPRLETRSGAAGQLLYLKK